MAPHLSSRLLMSLKFSIFHVNLPYSSLGSGPASAEGSGGLSRPPSHSHARKEIAGAAPAARRGRQARQEAREGRGPTARARGVLEPDSPRPSG